MPVGAVLEGEGFTQRDYEAVRDHVGPERPEGVLIHIAGATDRGWRVIEVWESEDAQRRFHRDRLAPAFAAAGLPDVAPAFFPVHSLMPPPEALAAPGP